MDKRHRPAAHKHDSPASLLCYNENKFSRISQELNTGIHITMKGLRDILQLTRQRFRPVSFAFVLLIFILLPFSYSISVAAEITGPEVNIQGNEIFITTALSLDEKQLSELRNGIKKEYSFYIDIFRVWKLWPDEFVLSRSFVRSLRADPVKAEFFATSTDGSTQIKKRFKSFDSMLHWALSFENFKLAYVRDLDPGTYFVRITVESKIRKLPPVIGYFMVFLPENEFTIKKDSPYFTIGSVR